MTFRSVAPRGPDRAATSGTLLRIAITGTRQPEQHLGRLAAHFDDLLARFAGAETSWLLGGAAGVDTLALRHLAAGGTGRLIVAVPTRQSDQPADARAAIDQAAAIGRLDRLIELAHPEGIGEAAFTARNRWLVEHADLVIGFPLAAVDDGSGTWQTLNYAAVLGRPYLVASLAIRRRPARPLPVSATGPLSAPLHPTSPGAAGSTAR